MGTKICGGSSPIIGPPYPHFLILRFNQLYGLLVPYVFIEKYYFSKKHLVTTASYKSLFSALGYDLDLSTLLPKLKKIFNMKWNMGSD